jgi:hypothetical protein
MYNPDIFGKDGLLDPEAMGGLVEMTFLNNQGNLDTLCRKVYNSCNFVARSYVLAQWLLVLKWNHDYYRDLIVDKIDETIGAVMNSGPTDKAIIETDLIFLHTIEIWVGTANVCHQTLVMSTTTFTVEELKPEMIVMKAKELQMNPPALRHPPPLCRTLMSRRKNLPT